MHFHTNCLGKYLAPRDMKYRTEDRSENLQLGHTTGSQAEELKRLDKLIRIETTGNMRAILKTELFCYIQNILSITIILLSLLDTTHVPFSM
jgi:hypothetical protein